MSEQQTPSFRLTVPWIGAEIALSAPWTFQLFRECRNATMWEVCGGAIEGSKWGWYGSNLQKMTVTLPVGTVLGVDRIYIRRGAVAYDSLTFWLKKTVDPRFTIQKIGKKGQILKSKTRSCRFWAKLADVNNIECQPIKPEGADAETTQAYNSFAGLGIRALEI